MPQTYHSLQVSQVCHHRKKYPSQKPKDILAQIVLIRSALYDFEIAFLQMILSFVIYIVFAPIIASMLSPWRGDTAASYWLPKSELSETVNLFEIVFFAIMIVFVIEIVFVIYIVFAPIIGSMLSPWRGESAASSCLPKSELSQTVTLFGIVFFCN